MGKVITLILSLLAFTLVEAYDFTSATSAGQVLHYDVLAPGRVAVSRPDRLGQYSGTLQVPERVEHEGVPYVVVEVGPSAFFGCLDLEQIALPQTIEAIRANAFGWCSSLRQFDVGPAVTTIEPYAFQGCDALEAIAVSPRNSAFKVVDGIVYSVDGQAVACPSGHLGYVCPMSTCTRIDDGVFYECTHIDGVNIPLTVTSIGDYAFYYCGGISSVAIPSTVSAMGRAPFGECASLERFDVARDNAHFTTDGRSLISVADSSLVQFAPCGDPKYAVPEGVRAIAPEAFFRAYGLEQVALPDGLKLIGDAAFTSCWDLRGIDLPASLTNIGECAFALCESLASVYVHTLDPEAITLGDNAFEGLRADCVLCVPRGALEPFANSQQWGAFKMIREYDEMLPQQIVWNQDFTDLRIGEEATLLAEATSGLPVHYALLSGSDCATLVGNRLTFSAAGVTVVEATQSGNERYMPAQPVRQSISVTDLGIMSQSVNDITVTGGYGVITITGADPAATARVFTPDGVCVYSGLSRSILLAPGIYAVTIANTSTKLAVR